MATFEVTSPTGEKYEITAPDNATEEQVLAYAQSQFGQQQQAQPSRPLLDRVLTGIGDLGRGFAYGASEAIGGGAQTLARAFEGGAQEYANNNPQLPQDRMGKAAAMLKNVGKQGAVYPTLADKMGGADNLAQAATQSRQQAENVNSQNAQTFRRDWMDGRDTTAADIGQVGGNIAATLPLTYALPGGGATTIPRMVGAGTLQGLVSSGFQPVDMSNGGDFWQKKGDQARTAAITGGIASGLLGLASKAFSGSSNPTLRDLADSGVRPTPGQAMGGMANTMEQKSTSIPFLGDMIRADRNRAIDQFDRATINKALKPIGEKIDDAAPLTRETIDDAATKVSDAYNNLLPKLTLKADNQMLADIQGLQSLAQNLPPEMAATFNKTLKSQVLDKIAQTGKMTGETAKAVESELGRLRTLYSRSAVGSEQELGRAIGELQSILRGTVERSNPMFRGQLAANNKAYAMIKRVEGAAAYVGGEAGKFTPNQLVSAVKAADKSRGKSAFARGNATMQDWAEGGKQVLGNTVPDSGTAGRVMAGAGMAATAGGVGLGAALSNPIIAGMGLLGLPYLPLLRDLPGYLAKSPNAYGRAAAATTKALAPAAARGAPAAFGLLNQ